MELINPCAAAAVLLEDNASQEMPERAAAVPAGVRDDDLDWRDWGDHQIEITQRWSSWASDHDLDIPTVVRVGCVWSFGARHGGRGRFLADAYLYAVVDGAGVGQRFSATGSFAPTPSVVGNGVAGLAASVELAREEFAAPADTVRLDLWIQGDGAGSISSERSGTP